MTHTGLAAGEKKGGPLFRENNLKVRRQKTYKACLQSLSRGRGGARVRQQKRANVSDITNRGKFNNSSDPWKQGVMGCPRGGPGKMWGQGRIKETMDPKDCCLKAIMGPDVPARG